jgi:hypothetical protein
MRIGSLLIGAAAICPLPTIEAGVCQIRASVLVVAFLINPVTPSSQSEIAGSNNYVIVWFRLNPPVC